MSHLALSFLGGFEATLDGQPISTFGTDKARALLAYLSIESGRPHRRAELTALLWPELLPRKAAHNLSQTLLRLRRALGEDRLPGSAAGEPYLLVDNQALQFNPLSNHRLDVFEFTELIRARRLRRQADSAAASVRIDWLHQAVDLYRGDLLAGFSLRDSVPFEEWLLVQQEALHMEAVKALAMLVSHYEHSGEPARVCEYARRLVALDPWHEQAQMKLMAALAHCGQKAAALEQYAAYRRALAQEFGLAPPPSVAALFEQIRALQAEAQTDPPAGRGHQQAGQAQVASGKLAGLDQRRQVTALIYGKRSPSHQVDPETLHQPLARWDAICAAIFERYGGQPQQRQGTQRLVYFGYPAAQEDAVRRAAHAALALAAAAPPGDPVYVGIHTGIMIVEGGELVGDVPDVARGCQHLAEPNSVWVTADTARLLAGWFDCQLIGPRSLPGSLDQMPVCRLVGEDFARNRLAWLARTRQLTRFTGREQELRLLAACLDRARAGQGQVIALCGEAGIGKSRLVWEMTRLGSWPFRWIESRCLPFFQNTSLYPWVGLLEQLLGFQDDDEPPTRLDKLTDTLLRLGLTEPATAWLLAILLGLPTQPPAPQTVTEEQRQRMRAAFLALLGRCAAEQPLALVIEDLQWADPSTVAWLDASLDALAAAGCLALFTYRPSFHPSWRPRRPLLQLNLRPLDPEQAASMAVSLADGATLPEPLLRRLAAQTDGIPLFVEELARAWLPDDAHAPGGAIPTTLHDLLLARLERVGAARETANWAATLGREFAYPILAAVVPYAEERLQADLAALVQADLIHPMASGAHLSYAFRHVLIQEAAHAALLRRDRKRYHRRIAETCAAAFPHMAATQPELLAEHFAQAGLAEQAADHWLKAGERATAQGAAVEARAFFERALASAGPQDHDRRWRVLHGREALNFLAGDRPAGQADISAMLELAQACGNQVWRAEALCCHLRFLNALGDYPAVLKLADEASTAARVAASPGLEARVLSLKAAAQTRLGDPAAHQTARLALAQAGEDEWATAFATGILALHEAYAGDYAGAAHLWERVLDMVRRGGDRALESRALSNLGAAYQYLGLFGEAQKVLEAGMALCDLIGDRHSHAYQVINLAGVKLLSGDLPAAEPLFYQALREATAVDDTNLAAGVRWELGALAERTGDHDGAAQHLRAARQVFAEHGMLARVVETDALLAQCALGQGRTEEARHLAGQVWNYLQERGTTAMDEAVSTYLALDRVFQTPAQGAQRPSDARPTHAIVEAGHALVMARMARISDPLWQRSFLDNVPANREMVRRWCEMQQAE